MTKLIKQFGFKFVEPYRLAGLPVLDCRIINNPFVRGIPDAILKEKVKAHPLFDKVVKEGIMMLDKHDTILIGCQFGKHRSGAVAEEIAKLTGAIIKPL